MEFGRAVDHFFRERTGRNDLQAIFAGVINGQTEDVQLFLTSKKLNGTVFMDETNDVTLQVGSRSINIDCQSEITF